MGIPAGKFFSPTLNLYCKINIVEACHSMISTVKCNNGDNMEFYHLKDKI